MPAPDPVRSLEVRVGLLVIAGLIAILAAILMSDRISFDRDYRVKIYLQDAGGLRESSPVTLAGLRIGEVLRVDQVRDSKGPICATIKVSSRYPLPSDATVVLATSGIFGDSSLAFSVPTIKHGEPTDLPMDGTAALVAGQGFFDELTGQAKGIVASVQDVLSTDTRKDIKRLVANAADLAGEAATLAKRLNEQNQRLSDTLAAVQKTVEHLDATIGTIGGKVDAVATQAEKTLAGVDTAVATLAKRADGTLAQADRLLADADGVVTANRAEVQAAVASLRQLLDQAAGIATSIRQGQGMLGQLISNPELATDLHRVVIDAKTAAATLADHPSSVVWGLDDDQVAKDKAERDRELARRAMANGFGPATAAPAH
jgi:phospholipid/cholesterol/gamma-HCH transport system substrate-binding protein